MIYGHFDDKAREFVITDPALPWPWINYLGTEDFFSLISATAGGYCFCKDAKFRRITRYRYNSVPADDGGRYFYVNDEKYSNTTIYDYIYPIDEGSVFLVNIILTYSGRPSTYPLKNCYKCVLSRNIPLGQRCIIDNEEYVEINNNTSTTRCNLFRYTTD